MKKIVFAFCCAVLFSACLLDNEEKKKTPDVVVDGHPDWIQQGNFYEINIRQYTPEGTFKAFEQHLDRLKAMGVQTLWFMPINPISKVDRKGSLGSYYAVSDYTAINPEYGNMDDWKNLVKKCHEKEFKVIIDWVPNHTGGDHYWLTKHPDFFVKDAVTGKPVSQFDWTDTRKLDYRNPALVDTMINQMKFWITESGIDGFRCDQSHLVGKGLFWKKCIAELKKTKSIIMLAESEDAWVHEEGFDASYPWKTFHATVDIAAGKKPASYIDTINDLVNKTFPKQAILMYFTSNHDENSWNKADYATMPGKVHAPFAVFTQTMARSVPLIYGGQEEPHLKPIRFFDKDTILFKNYERNDLYKKLLQLRSSNSCLAANAGFIKLPTSNDAAIYAYARERDGKRIVVVLNLSNKKQSFTINSPVIDGEPKDYFADKKVKLSERNSFELADWGYSIYVY